MLKTTATGLYLPGHLCYFQGVSNRVGRSDDHHAVVGTLRYLLHGDLLVFVEGVFGV
jgi:hypothetical protein